VTRSPQRAVRCTTGTLASRSCFRGITPGNHRSWKKNGTTRLGTQHNPTDLPVYLTNHPRRINGRDHYRASHGDYEKSVLPTGYAFGAPQETLDCTCGHYLGDPTA
jgi:hypothetical protein